MDTTNFLSIVVLVCCACASFAAPQLPIENNRIDVALSEGTTTVAPASSTTTVTEGVQAINTKLEARNCTTARRISGVCIKRQYCDYSTVAIDLTLYAPRSYQKLCAVDETCCPFDSVVRIEPTTYRTLDDDNAFTFDDDD